MCGRYSNTQDLSTLMQFVQFICRTGFVPPRYNIAPRQSAPVIVRAGEITEARLLRWGLIPSWAAEEGVGDRLINARAETVREKPSFRKPFARQRCLVPADGFYEWQVAAKTRTPFRFTRKDGGLFGFAGLWERWLDVHQDVELLPRLLRPYPAEVMDCVRVSARVNDAKFDGPECIAPA